MKGFGYPNPDRKEGNEWIYTTQKGKVSINVEKQKYSVDWTKGGGGAIDLAMTLEDLNFKGAIAWLKSINPDSGSVEGAIFQRAKKTVNKTKAATQKQKDELQIKADGSKLDQVKNYLTDERGLPEHTIEDLIQSGKIWANRHGSCVFPHRAPNGNLVGATVRGTKTGFKNFTGSKEEGFWAITSGSPTEANQPVLFESPIDAISAATRGVKGLLVSCAGLTVPKALRRLHSLFQVGFDSDKAGNKAARKILEDFPGSTRLKPTTDGEAGDWNTELKKSQNPSLDR